jgi:hypothetical protein
VKICPRCGKELRSVIAEEVTEEGSSSQVWVLPEGAEFDPYDLRQLGPDGELVPFRPRRGVKRMRFHCGECERWLATIDYR